MPPSGKWLKPRIVSRELALLRLFINRASKIFEWLGSTRDRARVPGIHPAAIDAKRDAAEAAEQLPQSAASHPGTTRHRERSKAWAQEEFPMDRRISAARERRPVTKKVGRFLACCTVIRDCRGYPQLRRGEAVALVLVMPEDADVDDYRQAVHFASMPVARPVRFDTEAAAKVVVAAEHWSKGTKDSTGAGLLKEDRFVVLAADIAEVPAMVLAAIDGIVELAAPEPRHLLAIGEICLNQRVSRQQAHELASIPLTVISAMLRRGRPVSHSLDCMRKAIAKPPPVELRQLRIEHLHGLGEAADWARELAIDLKDWREQDSLG